MSGISVLKNKLLSFPDGFSKCAIIGTYYKF